MNIMRFTPLILLCLGIFATACSKSDSSTEEVQFTDAQILSFNLKANDSILTSLDKVNFSINQYSGDIYNSDSLPFGTILHEKLLAEMSFNGASEAKIISRNDTTNYNSADSIDFTAPVKVIVTAYDKKTTKEYQVKVNIHQNDPDSMIWRKITASIFSSPKTIKTTLVERNLYAVVENSEGMNHLYKSTIDDAANWSVEGETNIPQSVNSLTHFQNKFWSVCDNVGLFQSTNGIHWELVNPAVITLLGQINGEMVYIEKKEAYQIVSTNFIDYKTIQTLPSNFPISGFASTTYTTDIERLIIIGGSNSAHITTNSVFQLYIENGQLRVSGDIHAKLSSWAPRSGAVAQFYNGAIYLFSGSNGTAYYNEVFTSINGGVNWKQSTEKAMIPSGFSNRSHMNLHIDSHNNLWFIGGSTQFGESNDIWKAKINKLN